MEEFSEILEISKELNKRGWVPATAGNISFRVGKEIYMSASGVHKGFLGKDDFVILDIEGNKLFGKGNPSAEKELHLVVYKYHPDVNVVFHVHSIYSTLVSKIFKDSVRLEGYELLKAFEDINTHEMAVDIPIFENSQDIGSLSKIVSSYFDKNPHIKGFLLKSHGVYTWGKTPKQAFYNLEALEYLFECELEFKRMR